MTISVLDKVQKPGIVSVDCGIGRFQHELVSPDKSCVLNLASPLYYPDKTRIYDRSGNGNHGTITGALWKRNSQGLWYLDFYGTDDHIDIGNLQISGSASFVLWVYVDYLMVSYATLYSNWQVGATTSCWLRRNATAESFQFGTFGAGPTEDWVSTVGNWISDLTWHLFIVTITGTTATITVDTTTETDTVLPLLASPNDFVYGETIGQGYNLKGKEWGQRIFTRVLPESKRLNIYNQERHLFGV